MLVLVHQQQFANPIQNHLKIYKMKRKLLTAVLAVFTLCTTVIAADGSKNVNHWVMEKFRNTYREVSDVSWVVTDQFAKATFLLEGVRTEAYFSTEGEFIAESKGIPTQELPRAAKRSLQKKYGSFTIKEVIQYATPDKTEYYVSLESEKESKILKISSSGDIEVYKSFIK